MLLAGATRICFVISPAKTDIMNYFGGQIAGAAICYVIQPNPSGLCDAIFTALPFLSPADDVLVGLPDTIWFPENGFCCLPERSFSFLLFPVDRPDLFDAVVSDAEGRVRQVQVKTAEVSTKWVWGAFRVPAQDLQNLHQLWQERGREDQYIGTLVNEYIHRGRVVNAVHGGKQYVDVGTLDGYREAVKLLSRDDHRYSEELNVAA
jgi:dTDP-glucose pyrophosphorylase